MGDKDVSAARVADLLPTDSPRVSLGTVPSSREQIISSSLFFSFKKFDKAYFLHQA